MSEHQHGKLERRRESKQKPFNQPLNKNKSEQSACSGASDWVKRKLNHHIRNKHRKLESQGPTQLCASNIPESLCSKEDSPLRRTASEPILKLRLKRSASGRQNPLQRKASAPPAVRASDSMGGSSSSSTTVSIRSSSADKKMNRQEPETYSMSSPHQLDYSFLQGESSVHADVQSTMLWTRYEQPLFALHPPVIPVHGLQPVVMSHRPLCKSQSAPSYYQHVHTQTIMITHPMYQQQWPHDSFQQHTETNVHLHTNTQSSFSQTHYKVPLHRVQPGSFRSLRKQRERTGEDLHIPSESPHGCCSNQSGVVQRSECFDVQKLNVYPRNLARVNSSPGTIDRSLPSRLSLPLGRDVRRKPNCTTGLVFDYQMKHECVCKDTSCDSGHAGRILSIWSRLKECGLWNQCKLVTGRPATFEELLSVHSEQLIISFFQKTFSMSYQSQTDHDTVLSNSCNAEFLKMSVGSLIALAFRVAGGELRNGFAVVTTPGHQASQSQTYGSSIFNSVAIAAKQLQEKLKVKKILIVDWDVHHGKGTEEIFYTDPSVLYISLHRYDDGSFFLGNGNPTRVGSDRGKGYNVNVAWSGGLNPPMGDAEYLAAFRTVVMPIAHEFSPDVVLVSAGFNAAEGHPETLGGYKVSANCFGFMTRKLMELAEGRVVLVLEGGYNPTSLCDSLQACVSALMGNKPEPSDKELVRKPCINAVESLRTVLQVQSRYWHSVRPMVNTVSMSYVNAERRYSAGREAALVLDGLHMTLPSSSRFLNEPMEHDEADSL
ncbi:histone deacetylase 4 isoform X2 [Puntigrus tetrazona]|uniref:histone deacetylase 4 isoform X2 n=1 Tax=Puntigrus tetrazona TaxID=1606681 RepID=UPI001C8980C5|nr:histone deacetylase 4 isoform X2 [Puntigrus tetrazona]